MEYGKQKAKTYCLKMRQYKQMSLIFTICALIGLFVGTDALRVQQSLTVRKSTLIIKKARGVGRSIASFIPNDEIEPLPFKEENWVNQIFVEDSAGVLNSIKNDISRWSAIEEYAELWDIRDTGLYHTPTIAEKKNYLSKRLLRYVDKRISGKVKNAAEGSALKSVAKAREALRPNTTAKISKNISIKFRAKILRGRVFIKVNNPWVETDSQVALNGDIRVNMRKNIEALKLETRIEYDVDDGRWIAAVDRPITKSFRARVSSNQTDKEFAFAGGAEKRVELLFNRSF